MQHRYIACYKPALTLCSLKLDSDRALRKNRDERQTLANLSLPDGLHIVGRLDRDSEGLLLLTDDGRLQAQISNPKHKWAKTYLAQVEGTPDAAALKALAQGVVLKDGKTRPAQVRIVDAPDWLWPRTPPIRVRKNIPDTWVELTITEGKNRQVRRMTAHVGHPTLRLIRVQIGPIALNGLESGAYRDVTDDISAGRR